MKNNIRLINGEALKIMDDLIKEGIVVDCVLTDPPYGTTACKWDSVIPFEPMWERLNKLIKPNGAIVLFGSEPFSSALRMSNINKFRHEWIWEKDKGANFLQSNFQPLKVHENITVFAKGKTTYNPQKTINPNKQSETFTKQTSKIRKEAGLNVEYFKSSDRYEKDKLMPRSIQYFKRIIPRGGNIHPTQKPVALMEYLIKTYTNEGETVLDFTMGSGTTGVACKNLNRNFIGIELDEKYYNIAKERILMTNNLCKK